MKNWGASQQSNGFTLIELMATMVVGMILLVSGGVMYFRFQSRQQAEVVARGLQKFVVATRQRARTLDREGCPTGPGVVGYKFTFNSTSSPQATALGQCGLDRVTPPADGVVVADYTLPASVDSVSFNGNSSQDVLYYAYSLYGGTDLGSDVTVNVENGGATYQFTLGTGGEISEVERL